MIVSATEYFRKINQENGTDGLSYCQLRTEAERNERKYQEWYPCQWIEIDDEKAKRLKLREVADAKRIEKALRENEINREIFSARYISENIRKYIR